MVWARDYRDVFKHVRAMVKGNISRCGRMRVWLRGNSSEIRYGSDGNTYIVGKYSYDQKSNTLTVTELPPGTFNESYKNAVGFIEKKDDKKGVKRELRTEFKSITDGSNYDEETNTDEIKIDFELAPGVMEKWSAADDKDAICDGVEKAMGLCVKVNSHMNMIMPDGSVSEFKYYSVVVNTWFEERKKLYEARITRLTILTKLTIRYLQNIIRFTKERDSYGITNKTPEQEFNAILAKHGYDKFNKTLLFSPKYTAIEELEGLIIGGGKGGDAGVANDT